MNGFKNEAPLFVSDLPVLPECVKTDDIALLFDVERPLAEVNPHFLLKFEELTSFLFLFSKFCLLLLPVKALFILIITSLLELGPVSHCCIEGTRGKTGLVLEWYNHK